MSMKKISGILGLATMFLPSLAVATDCAPYCRISDYFYAPRLFMTPGPAGALSFGELMVMIFNIVFFVVGSVAVLFLIIGGFRYIASRGNEEAAEGAKKMMTAAVVGLVVVFMSFAMVYIISTILITGSTGTGIGP